MTWIMIFYEMVVSYVNGEKFPFERGVFYPPAVLLVVSPECGAVTVDSFSWLNQICSG